MKYLLFNTTMHAFIPTDITDSKEARAKLDLLNAMFPSKDWDYSNADWTLKYSKLDDVMNAHR